MKKNEKFFKVWTVTQFLLGIGTLFLTYKIFPSDFLFQIDKFPSFREYYFLLLIFLLSSILCLQYKIVMASNYFISFDITFSLAAFFILGPLSGIIIAVLTTTFDIFIRMKRNRHRVKELKFRLFDNCGNRLLRFVSLIIVSHFVNNNFSNYSTPEYNFLLGFVFIIPYFLVNNIFYVPSEYFRGSDLKLFWRDSFRIDLFHTFLMFILAIFLYSIYYNVGLFFTVLTSLMILGGSYLIASLRNTQVELYKKIDSLEILTSVYEAASSGLDLMPMVETFSRKLCQSLKADGIGVVFVQPYSITLNAVQVEGEKSRTTQLPEEEKRYQYDSLPLSEPSVQLGKALYEFLQPLETAPFMIPPSCFGVPLIYRGEPIGGIVAYSWNKEREFTSKESLLFDCAHALVVGMENCFLHLQAIEDPLTSLYNRSYFLYRLREELSYSTRHRSNFAVLMMDLDNFKIVNDTLGHQVGDDVLRRIGELLRTTLRKEDVPARYGGDEFIILLINCDEANAIEKANKIRRMISVKGLPKEKAQGIQIGCSISLLSSKKINDDRDVTTIIRKLDEALYKAKSKGRGGIVNISE